MEILFNKAGTVVDFKFDRNCRSYQVTLLVVTTGDKVETRGLEVLMRGDDNVLGIFTNTPLTVSRSAIHPLMEALLYVKSQFQVI